MSLIRTEDFEKKLDKLLEASNGYRESYLKLCVRFAKTVIEACDPVDAKPLKHAFWVPDHASILKGKFHCSNCGRKIAVRAFEKLADFKYCNECGAIMDMGMKK